MSNSFFGKIGKWLDKFCQFHLDKIRKHLIAFTSSLIVVALFTYFLRNYPSSTYQIPFAAIILYFAIAHREQIDKRARQWKLTTSAAFFLAIIGVWLTWYSLVTSEKSGQDIGTRLDSLDTAVTDSKDIVRQMRANLDTAQGNLLSLSKLTGQFKNTYDSASDQLFESVNGIAELQTRMAQELTETKGLISRAIHPYLPQYASYLSAQDRLAIDWGSAPALQIPGAQSHDPAYSELDAPVIPQQLPAYVERVNAAYETLKTGDFNGACAEWEAVIRDINPDDCVALNNLGMCEAMRLNYSRAIDCFTQAKRINPNYERPYKNLAWLYREMNNEPAARAVETEWDAIHE